MLRVLGHWSSSFFTRPAADEFAAVFAPLEFHFIE
jgi:hypothetical protein